MWSAAKAVLRGIFIAPQEEARPQSHRNACFMKLGKEEQNKTKTSRKNEKSRKSMKFKTGNQ